MQFIYVLPRWKRSAHDGRVLRDVVTRRNGLKVPNGCYYLVDGGYTNGKRDGYRPTTPAEFINMKHSSARNVIERRQQKHYWTTTEDTILVESLLELHNDPTWRADIGFKNVGSYDAMMEAKLPGCGLKASPHIESRIKMLKAKYFALTELLALSGFEWNEEKMMLACEKSVYDETTKGKKDASGLYNKPFPHYHSLGEIYAKDRVVGANVGNADDDEEEVRLEDANVNQNEGEDESGNDFDTSFSVPNTQQQRNAESNTSNRSRKRARVRDEMAKQFSVMAKAIADVGPKLDGLVHALSTDINLIEMQQKLDGHQLLAKEHDLLMVFFNMSDERKSAYVTTLLQTWVHNDVYEC
ncbi:hypothetical protein D8674_037851 [Pyrus ussuriensis x Pyrus communis]|uniref:Myb/SANT-like domain-containing protein n=1 Tax=Pyrus ussuriensis x Pyrus communis TaxID=2448454 RepID=A0A5N5H8E5_9ROSA|nr:hypothetical protein D8674_037851 [Pyrus ussuriensis x Pyrus communis]